MKLEYLNEFIAVSDLRNFTKASEKLFITQSALSRHIAVIESELGVNLIERNTHEVSLTPWGREAYKIFKKILTDYSELGNKIQRYSNGLEGHLKIGMLYYAIEKYTAPVIKKIMTDYPQIHLSYYSCQPYQMLEALQNNYIDIGLINDFDDSSYNEFSFYKILDIGFTVLHSEKHPFTKYEKVTLDDLHDETIICLNVDTYSNQITLNALKNCGFVPKNIIYTEHIDTVPFTINNTQAVHITSMDLRNTFSSLRATDIDAVNLKASVGYAYKKNNDNFAIPLFLKELDSIKTI